MQSRGDSMKIGILGGTFNPIHNGHLALGRYAKEKFELDQIWIMPNGNPPHKKNAQIESNTNHRVEMARLAIAEEEGFCLQLYEVERKEVNYSYLTMEHFVGEYPHDEFYFIIGADSLFNIEKWKCPERLLKTCIILAANRDGRNQAEMEQQIQYVNQKYDADIRLLNMPMIDISSTEIREDMKELRTIRNLVPTSVYEYIIENQLFKDERI